MSWIYLYTGKKFDLEDIESNVLEFADFAHAICLIPRYTGNTTRPYTVGEHSVKGSLLRATTTLGFECERAFLIHDFSEVVVNDIPSPVKRMLPEYVELEERVQRQIFRELGVSWEAMEAIQEIDKNMCQGEMMQVFKDPIDIGRMDLGNTVEFWPWHVAETQMTIRARTLEFI